MIDGTTVKINGTEYVVAPLTFKQVKKLQSDINEIGSISGALSEEKIDKMLNILLAAFSRNYPEMTLDTLEELIDLANAKSIFEAVLGVSGIFPKKAEA